MQLSQFSLGQQRPNFLHARMVLKEVTDHQNASAVGRQFHQLFSFPGIEAERFFHKNVFARQERRTNQFVVGYSRSCNRHLCYGSIPKYIMVVGYLFNTRVVDAVAVQGVGLRITEYLQRTKRVEVARQIFAPVAGANESQGALMVER